MHDAAKVIHFPERVDLAWFHLQEVILLSCSHTHTQTVSGLNAKENIWRVQWSEHAHPFTLIRVSTHTRSDGTWLDVVSDDAYMLVSVRTCVLVPEADHVAEFVHHDAELVAVLPYGDGLRAAASPSHVGAAPAEHTLTLCCWRILKGAIVGFGVKFRFFVVICLQLLLFISVRGHICKVEQAVSTSLTC